MQAAGPGEALVATGSTTSPAVEALLDRRPSIRVKGKAEPIAVAALRSSPPSGRTEGERAYELPVIARELELELGAAAVGKAAAGAGGVLLITGEPGIGKSRLAAELGRIAAQRGFSVLTGACQSTGATTSYLPWQDILRALFELDDTAPVDRQIEVLTDRLRNIDAQLVPRLPLLAPAVRLPIPETPSDACARSRASCGATPGAAHRGPAPLRGERPGHARARGLPLDRPALESTVGGGWAQRRQDGRSRRRAFARRRARALRGAGGLEHATELRLEPLRSHDAEDLARAKLRAAGRELDELPPAVRDAVGRAEGNPFFLEELIALLLERGIDLEDPSAFARAAVPDTLYGVVMARIDQLAERDKSVLKVASVIGRAFRAQWVWSSAPELGGEPAVRSSLGGLIRAELIARAAAAADLEHLFRHVTTRDVAYDSLPFALRRDLHERVAAHVESAYASALDQYVDTLAHHYSLSANTEKQRVYLQRAADNAKATYANAAALDYYERLLPLLDDRDRVTVLLAMGGVREHVGDWSAAKEAYREAMELAAARGDASSAAEARRAQGMLLAHEESPGEARAMLEQARDELEAEGDEAGVVHALEGLAYVTWKQSDLDASLAYSREHLEAAEARDDAAGISMAVEQMGLAYWHQGKHELARASFEHALEVAAAAENARGVIHACNDLAGLHWERREFAEALERVREGLRAAEEIGYRHAAGVLIGNAAEIFRLRGELDQALAHGRYSLDVVSEVGNRVGVTRSVGNAALTLAAMERDDDAETLFEHAIALARAAETPYFLCEYLHYLADLLVRQGRHEDALARNEEALEIARAIERHDVESPAELLSVRARDRGGPARHRRRSGRAPADRRPQRREPGSGRRALRVMVGHGRRGSPNSSGVALQGAARAIPARHLPAALCAPDRRPTRRPACASWVLEDETSGS